MNAVANVKPKARILMCTEAEYRADPCVVPSLSQSTAHTLLTKSPLHAWSEHPRLGKVPRETTVAKIEGTVIHALLLGKGADDIEVLSYDNFKTKSSQIARDAVLNAGRTPVLARKYDEIVAAADRIRKNLADQGCVFEGGMAEVAIEWEEEGPEGPVLCRGRLDYLIVGEHRAKIIDPKKITSADVLTCMRHADDYGYHIQHTAYTSAVEKLYPHLAGRVDFEFAFTELDEPHASVPRAPDAMSKFVGAQQWSRAIEIWQQCMTSGVWSGYPITPLTVSPWVWREYEEGMSV